MAENFYKSRQTNLQITQLRQKGNALNTERDPEVIWGVNQPNCSVGHYKWTEYFYKLFKTPINSVHPTLSSLLNTFLQAEQTCYLR